MAKINRATSPLEDMHTMSRFPLSEPTATPRNSEAWGPKSYSYQNHPLHLMASQYITVKCRERLTCLYCSLYDKAFVSSLSCLSKMCLMYTAEDNDPHPSFSGLCQIQCKAYVLALMLHCTFLHPGTKWSVSACMAGLHCTFFNVHNDKDITALLFS